MFNLSKSYDKLKEYYRDETEQAKKLIIEKREKGKHAKNTTNNPCCQ